MAGCGWKAAGRQHCTSRLLAPMLTAATGLGQGPGGAATAAQSQEDGMGWPRLQLSGAWHPNPRRSTLGPLASLSTTPFSLHPSTSPLQKRPAVSQPPLHGAHCCAPAQLCKCLEMWEERTRTSIFVSNSSWKRDCISHGEEQTVPTEINGKFLRPISISESTYIKRNHLMKYLSVQRH